MMTAQELQEILGALTIKQTQGAIDRANERIENTHPVDSAVAAAMVAKEIGQDIFTAAERIGLTA